MGPGRGYQEQVQRLREAVIVSTVDALTFTSAPAVDTLFAAASVEGLSSGYARRCRDGCCWPTSSDCSAALLRELIRAEGVVVSQGQLARGGAAGHSLEMSVSWLRATLGVPGLIVTVVKRGYRLRL